MTEYAELMRIKYAISAIRERTNQDLNAMEAEIDRLLPDDPGPGLRVPQGREARKRYWKKHGIRNSASHGRRISSRKSKAMKTGS